jgi:phosphatidylglycerophosphate synthase
MRSGFAGAILVKLGMLQVLARFYLSKSQFIDLKFKFMQTPVPLTRYSQRLLDPMNRLYRQKLAYVLALKLKDTPVTPNWVTLAHTLVGVFAAVCVYRQHYVIAVLFLEIRALLDCADGVLARLKNQSTAVGRVLDTIGDGVAFNALMIAGALRMIQDFRSYDPLLIVSGVFIFAFLAANCGTVYHLMKRKLGSIMQNELDSVELEWREHYEKIINSTMSFGVQTVAIFGFWLDSITIRFISLEWYQKVRRRRDAADWKERALRESAHFNELACNTRVPEFKRAVRATAFVSDDNILGVISFVFLILGIFPNAIFPHVHPVLIAFSVGMVYALTALLFGLHFLHRFLHGVYRE